MGTTAGGFVDRLRIEPATEPPGAFAAPCQSGNMGGRLLEPFVLVFDDPRERRGFLPR